MQIPEKLLGSSAIVWGDECYGVLQLRLIHSNPQWFSGVYRVFISDPLLFFSPCSSVNAEDKLEVQYKVSDQNGKHRLLVRATVTKRRVELGEIHEYHFHSLVWEESNDKEWNEKVKITRDQFEGDTERCVNELHSLDASRGRAIMKIAEMEPTDARGSRRSVYSWCEWDLVNNKKLRTIKVCKEPFESFDSKKLAKEVPVPPSGMNKLLEEARELARQGKYDDSLQKLIYFHENAAKKEPFLAGVRLSVALSDWMELGEKYPKAREALIAIRDKNMKSIDEGKATMDIVMDVFAINSRLKESEKNVSIFKALEQKKSSLVQMAYIMVEKDLIDQKEYSLCSKYLKNPLNKMSQLIWMRSMQANRTNEIPMLADSADEMFTEQTRQLLKILVNSGRSEEAQKVKEKALTVINTPEMRAKLDEVTKETTQK